VALPIAQCVDFFGMEIRAILESAMAKGQSRKMAKWQNAKMV